MIKFNSLAGNFYPQTSMRDGEQILAVHNCVVDEFFNYINELESAGFEKINYRKIGANKECDYSSNHYASLKNGDRVVHVFFDAPNHTVRIVERENCVLPTEPIKESKIVTPSITQISIFAGMCYCVGLSNGNYIMFDCGVHNVEDEKRLYTFLTENNFSDNKPIIENWFFTHPDVDHIELATHFFKEYGDKVDIRAVSYNFPDCDKINRMVMTDRVQRDILAFEESIKINIPTAKKYTIYTGQEYKFAGVNVEVIWSAEANYPKTFTSYNDISACFKLNFESGKTAILLGDCGHGECKQIAETYGEYLKSNVLQVAHHGLIGGDKRLYKFIDPEFCFWPTTEIRFNGKLENQKYQWCIGEGGCDYNAYIRDESIRKRQHFSHGKTVTLKMGEEKIAVKITKN